MHRSGRRVDALQRRHGPLADAVAGVEAGVVRFILHISLPERRAVCLGLGAAQAQQRPPVDAALRADAAQPVQAGAARQAQQHGLGLVGQRVGGGDLGFLARGQLVEPGVAQAAGPVLAGVVGDGHARAARVIQKQLHALFLAQARHKAGVLLRCFAAQAVVHMGGEHLDGKLAAAAQQKQQEGHRVRPTGAGCNDPVARLEQALPFAVGKQGLLCPGNDSFAIGPIHNGSPRSDGVYPRQAGRAQPKRPRRAPAVR